MPRPDTTDEDYDQATEESSLVSALLVMASLLLMFYGLVAGVAYYELAADVGVPHLRLRGVENDVAMFCMVVAPLVAWLWIAAVLVRRLPWWAHFSGMPYQRERNILCWCTALVFAESAALTLTTMLWS